MKHNLTYVLLTPTHLWNTKHQHFFVTAVHREDDIQSMKASCVENDLDVRKLTFLCYRSWKEAQVSC